MKNNRVFFVAILLITGSFMVYAVQQSDNTNVAAPTDNGTSSNLTVTGRMEQYVGFYGNLTMQVRNNTAVGNVLYTKPVSQGVLYFFETGVTPSEPFVNASTNSTTDGNFSLTGYYVTANHFDSSASDGQCGSALNMRVLNTTDSRSTAIIYDSTGAGTEKYGFCTNLSNFATTSFGRINYQVVVAKTAGYNAYDIWFDLT
ncbi:hypothetical protein KJ765_04370 [Candidatus Micrarchaeota archaeon]|nr:hypothetical protein [Candidatus Micrarchaeota archaeon]